MNDYAATLSVDLGASYTKVSYRPRLTPLPNQASSEDAKILMVEGSSLIPSLAIYTNTGRKPWLFGRTAAATKPSADMKVFVNWKSNFFRRENDELSIEAAIIAGNFFAWLREQIEDGTVELTRTETRVAVPAFEGFEAKAEMLARCMELNGWRSPKILRSTEPHANTIGLFSYGKNVVGRTANGKILLQYNNMFGQNVYIQRARQMILGGASSTLKVLIVDIGAFTTDLATLTFDLRAEGDGLQNVIQESHALGIINELDRGLFRDLGQRYGFSWSHLSFDESETAKRNIYRGESYALLLANFRGEIGGAKDQDLLTRHVSEFTGQVWKIVTSAINQERPAAVFLTGGGSLIKNVVTDLNGELSKSGVPTAETWNAPPTVGNEKWRRWDETGEGLTRLATAIGGASVILQNSGLQRNEGEFAPIDIPEPIDAYYPCSCLGGNKDCCKCGGRGFYKKS